MCHWRASASEPAGLNVLEVGSQTSAEASRWRSSFEPPTTRTRPSGRSVAVWDDACLGQRACRGELAGRGCLLGREGGPRNRRADDDAFGWFGMLGRLGHGGRPRHRARLGLLGGQRLFTGLPDLRRGEDVLLAHSTHDEDPAVGQERGGVEPASAVEGPRRGRTPRSPGPRPPPMRAGNSRPPWPPPWSSIHHRRRGPGRRAGAWRCGSRALRRASLPRRTRWSPGPSSTSAGAGCRSRSHPDDEDAAVGQERGSVVHTSLGASCRPGRTGWSRGPRPPPMRDLMRGPTSPCHRRRGRRHRAGAWRCGTTGPRPASLPGRTRRSPGPRPPPRRACSCFPHHRPRRGRGRRKGAWPCGPQRPSANEPVGADWPVAGSQTSAVASGGASSPSPATADDEDAAVGQGRGRVFHASIGERACRGELAGGRVPDLRRGEGDGRGPGHR